jgi:opacity protein-like surface antigen
VHVNSATLLAKIGMQVHSRISVYGLIGGGSMAKTISQVSDNFNLAHHRSIVWGGGFSVEVLQHMAIIAEFRSSYGKSYWTDPVSKDNMNYISHQRALLGIEIH